MTNTYETTATASVDPAAENGAVLFVPRNTFKKSLRNSRKTAHSETHIEALAASIAAKGMLQNLVVEPETNADGERQLLRHHRRRPQAGADAARQAQADQED